MSYRELAKQVSENLYPDIVSAGGLVAALREALGELPSVLEVDPEEPLIPLPFARVAKESRFSQVFLAANERLFVLDFWSDGVSYGKAACMSLTQASYAINLWISEAATIATMEAHIDTFAPTAMGRSHEAG